MVNTNHFIIKRSDLEGRIEPAFYSPKYVSLIKKLKTNKHFRLKDVVKFSSETWDQQEDFKNYFPYLEISEINLETGSIQNIKEVKVSEAPSRAKMKIRNNDIIISTTRPSRGAISHIQNINNYIIGSTGFSVIREVNENIISREALYKILRLPTSLMQMEQRSSGGNYPAISQQELGNIILPSVSKDSQQKIVNLYQSAYTKKQQKEELAQNLLKGISTYALSELGITMPIPDNTLKNRMFTVKFSEVAGDRLDANSAKNKDLEEALFNGRYKTVKLRKVIRNIKTGTTPHNSLNPYADEGIVFVRNTNLKEGQLVLDDVKFIRKKLKSKLTYSQKNDVIICIAGTVGSAAINNLDFEVSINQNVSSLTVNQDLINPHFLNLFLNTDLSAEMVKSRCSIATILYINNSNLLNLFIPLPPVEKQMEMVTNTSNIRKKVNQLRQEAKWELENAIQQVERIILHDE